MKGGEEGDGGEGGVLLAAPHVTCSECDKADPCEEVR